MSSIQPFDVVASSYHSPSSRFMFLKSLQMIYFHLFFGPDCGRGWVNCGGTKLHGRMHAHHPSDQRREGQIATKWQSNSGPKDLNHPKVLSRDTLCDVRKFLVAFEVWQGALSCWTCHLVDACAWTVGGLCTGPPDRLSYPLSHYVGRYSLLSSLKSLPISPCKGA